MKIRFHCWLLSTIGGLSTLAVIGSAVFSVAQYEPLSSNLTQETEVTQLGDGPTSPETVIPPGPEPFFPAPTCWVGLDRLDKQGNLEVFRAAIHQALASDDFLLTAYLRERMAELANANPKVALDVMTSAESAQGDELMSLSEAIKRSKVVNTPEVVDQLLTKAERHEDLNHRLAALQALKAQTSLTPAQLDRLTALGKAENREVSSQAILALGHVLRNDVGRVEEYTGRLLDIAETQTNPEVADLALSMRVPLGVPLEAGSVQRLTDLLLHHPYKYARQKAGLVLTEARDTNAALKAFQQAFRQYDSYCFRWDMIRFSVTVAGAEALPSIKELAELDPRFQVDYLEYKELYGSGMADYVQVFWEKKTRHDECSVDEWAQPQ